MTVFEFMLWGFAFFIGAMFFFFFIVLPIAIMVKIGIGLLNWIFGDLFDGGC